MKKFINLFIYLGVASCVTFFSVFALANSQSASVGKYEFDITLDYFKTTSNFSSAGTKESLPSGNHLQSINTMFRTRYTLTEQSALVGGVVIGNTESKDNLATRTNSSLSHVVFGGDYRIIETQLWNLTAEGSFTYILDKFNAATDAALNNDGANEIKALLGMSYFWGDFRPFAKGGINYRFEGLSTLFIYSLGSEIRYDSFYYGFLLNGVMTIKDDEKTQKAFERESVTNRVNASSKRYHSINPNLLDTEVYITFKLNKNFSIKPFAGYTLSGSNTAEGFHMGITVGWGHEAPIQRFKSQKTELKNKNTDRPTAIDPSDKGFKEDTNDGVNQDYFKNVNPSKDNYIEQLEGPSKNLQNATEPEPESEQEYIAPISKPKPKPVFNPAIEKDYKIKIKKKKKKKGN